MDIQHWGDIVRLIAWTAVVVLVLCVTYWQWLWYRRSGQKVDRREFWRYGKGDALDERYRAVELLEAAARGCDLHGLPQAAQGMRDAASLVAQPHFIDTYAPRTMVLPFWLADYMRDHRARAQLFGERKDTDDSGN